MTLKWIKSIRIKCSKKVNLSWKDEHFKRLNTFQIPGLDRWMPSALICVGSDKNKMAVIWIKCKRKKKHRHSGGRLKKNVINFFKKHSTSNLLFISTTPHCFHSMSLSSRRRQRAVFSSAPIDVCAAISTDSRCSTLKCPSVARVSQSRRETEIELKQTEL